jgi:asparagine synthase (glutamine-hydrolysing)
MCGIVALHSRDHRVDQDRLCRAMNALRHRGPDDEGQWFSPTRTTCLGHRRLSVIDLETGTQPITNEDGSVAVTVNGELYGFEEIRARLEQRGHRFRTKSDSEIIVHLYEELGEDCVHSLRGEFAFVLFDSRSDKLFAARDRFGIKPLFYAEYANELLIASEAKALFAAGLPATWNTEAVMSNLFFCIGDESLFEGVSQLPPGHTLTSRHGATTLHRYWDANYPGAGADFEDDEQSCIEKTRALTEESIRLRMRADVPVGCLLSGGLDSSAVLGFASRMSDITMRAFTIAFDDPDFDESSLARDTASYTFADFEPVDASKVRLADHFAESVAQGEIIQYNAHGTARYLLSRAVRDAGYKVVLAGEGADELFGGYGFASTAILSRKSGRLPMLLRLLRPSTESERSIRKTSPWLVRTARLLNLNPSMTDPLAQRMELLRSILSSGISHDPYRHLFETMDPMSSIRGREPAKQLIYLWMKSVFPNYVLAADRADMAHGVEVRLPFLDHVLFEYVKRIPVSILAANGERKHVLREVARDVIPADVRNRVKKPLMAPSFSRSSEDPLNQAVRDIVVSDEMRSVPFFDSAELSKLVDQNRDGIDPLLLMAASLCIIQGRYSVT